MIGQYIHLMLVEITETKYDAHPVQVYICDYCGCFVPKEHERTHDMYHQRHYDPRVIFHAKENPDGRD